MDKRQQILDRLQQLQQEIDEIKNYLLQNDSDSSSRSARKAKRVTNLTVNNYQTSFSWQQKIVFILRYQNKPLLSSEIVSFMDDFDSIFQYKRTELDKVKMLSTHLNRAVKKEVIRRFRKTGTRGYFYALPETE